VLGIQSLHESVVRVNVIIVVVIFGPSLLKRGSGGLGNDEDLNLLTASGDIVRRDTFNVIQYGFDAATLIFLKTYQVDFIRVCNLAVCRTTRIAVRHVNYFAYLS
jgi:hypothetical protein